MCSLSQKANAGINLSFWETAQPRSDCNIQNVKLYILFRISMKAVRRTPGTGKLAPT